MDGLSAAASGMTADERWQQVVMNNIANLSTPGFKQSSGELMAFPAELAARYSAGGNGSDATPIGRVQDGTWFQESVNNFSQGTITATNQPLDLAIRDPAVSGTTVYALTRGANGVAAPAEVATLSFVVGRGGVVETAQGQPILPVDAAGLPISGARVVVNPAFKGLDLFGENGIPTVDSAGQPSYTIVGANGRALPQQGAGAAFVRMQNSSTGGVHSFFAVANVDAAGRTEVALTRDGHLTVGANGYLYTATGQRVLAVDAAGRPILNSAIRMNPAYTGTAYFGPGGAALTDSAGQPSYRVVTAAGASLAGARFGLTAADVGTLVPLGQTDFLTTAATVFAPSRAGLQAGALESSNVNDSRNMVDMLNIYQNYVADQKVIQTFDTTLQSTVTQVGQVQGL